MRLVAILTFFFIAWGLGYGILRLAKARESDVVHEAIAALGVGLAAWSFLGVVFGLFRIPIHVIAYLVLAAAYPLWAIVSQGKGTTRPVLPKGEKIIHLAILGALVLGTFWLMYAGAHSYPYLENDDPWNHAQSATYVAREHSYRIDPPMREINGGYAFYLEPYPPTYDILMGLMRQLNDSIMWTLKAFNAIIIALAIAFAYLFFRAYLKDDRQAIVATSFLAVLPGFMSHFIWSQTLGIALIAVGGYAFLRALEEKEWIIPAILCIASQLVSQPVTSFVFGVTLLLITATVLLHEFSARKGFAKTRAAIITGASGLALSFVYWGDQLAKWGVSGFMAIRGSELTVGGWAGAYALQHYTLREVLFPPHASRIDQAVGWGLGISLLALIGVICIIALWRKTLDPRKGWAHAHVLVWFALLFLAVFGPSFGLPGWGSHRAWVYLAFPLAAIAAVGSTIIAKSATKKATGQLAILAVLVAVVMITSLPAKVDVQTSQWPPGGQWTGVQNPDGSVAYPDLEGHLRMANLLPKNTRVFPFCSGDHRVIGFDMQSDPWDPSVGLFRKTAANATGEEVVQFMTEHQYGYFTIDATCVRDWGPEPVTALVTRISDTGRVQPIDQSNGFLLLKVV